METGKFTVALDDILYEEFKKTGIVLNEEIDKASGFLVNRLKTTAPKGHRRSHYADKWTSEKIENGRIVYVKAPDYRLSHLLEYGHDIVKNGKRVGRASAKPFIGKAEKEANAKFLNAVERRLENG